MHQKAMKICTLKFLGCYLAQRVHGRKRIDGKLKSV
jgi:hypothetical protein